MSRMGEGDKRLKERLLIAEYRAMQAEIQAQKAEKMAKDVLGKLEIALNRLEKLSITSGSESYTFFGTDSAPATSTQEQPGEIQENRERIEEKKPFWSIPRAKVEFTTEELGKGRWGVVRVAKYNGESVAARCLYRQSNHRESRKAFVESMEVAATLRHTNLVPLIGVILEGEPVVLTEIMPMNLKKVLEMGKLYDYQIACIALDVANALLFLHETKPNPIFHGDLPSTSVLLQKEAGNLWRAKLYKFMLAKYVRTSAVLSQQSSFDRDRSLSPTIQEEGSGSRSSTPRITPPPLGYRRKISGSDLALNRRLSSRKQSQTAPDAFDPITLTPQRDVYHFGLLLVEMCTGTQPLEVSLQFLVESITWTAMFTLVKSCTEFNTRLRPSTKSLVGTLQEVNRSFASTRPIKFK